MCFCSCASPFFLFLLPSVTKESFCKDVSLSSKDYVGQALRRRRRRRRLLTDWDRHCI